MRQHELQAGLHDEDRHPKQCGDVRDEQYCVPGKTTHKMQRTYTSAASTPAPARRTCKPSGWELVCCKQPDQVRTRQVTHYRKVCEQVPCTTYVKECHVEKVP